MFDCLLTATARTVPGGAWRIDVVEVARQSVAGEGVGGRARELAGVAVFGLRLRSVRATAGRADVAWRQGVGLGAVLLLGTALAGQLSVIVDDGPNVVTGAAAVATAAALSVAVTGNLRAAAALSGLAVALALATPGATAGSWTPVVSSLVVGLVAMVLSAPSSRTAVPGGRWWLLVLGLPCLAVILGGGAGVAAAVGWAATFAVPLGLLVVGGADARLAAAAVVTWTWRFLAIDPTDVRDAVAALRDGQGLDAVLVRVCLMAWGVAVAVLVAHRSARRAAAL